VSLVRRLLNTFRSARIRSEIQRELAFHLDERADHLQAEEGVSGSEARRRARLQFGDPLLQVDRTRDVDVAQWLDALLRTFRHAVRALVRTPGFTLTAVVILGACIGVNTAVFSVVDAVLLKPLPFADGDRLVRVRQVVDAETNIAPRRLEDWSRRNAAFEALSGYYVEDVADTTGEVPERVRRAVVAPRFLDVLRAVPVLGRDFVEAEYRFGGPPALLISDRYWRRRFAGDPNVLQATVRLEGRTHSIAGVMPPSFVFPDRSVDLWWPYPVDAPKLRDVAGSRTLQWYTGIGRLKQQVTVAQARTDLAIVQNRLADEYRDTDANMQVRVVPLKETVIGGFRASLLLLFAAVSVLLLIASTNIGALMLSRSARRAHEIAIRFSLGASPAMVAGQLLAETAALSGAGAVAGVIVSAAIVGAVRGLAPNLPRVDEIAIDVRIWAYTVALAAVVTVICGTIPAVRSTRTRVLLPGAARADVSSRHALQWLLVGVQVTLSVALLAGAGLLLRSLDALARVDPGFEPAHVLVFRMSGNWAEEEDRSRLVQRINRTLDELAAIPGIESAATAWSLPGVPRQYAAEFQLAEGRPESEPPLHAEWRTVSPGYFRTLRIPLIAGTPCRAHDGRSTELIVSRSFADRYFPGRSAIGHHLAWEDASQNGRIVGVAADARELGVDRDPAPTVYACDVAPSPFPWLLLRTTGEPLASIGAVRATLGDLEPLRSVHDIAPLEERIGDAYLQNRFRTLLLGLFAAAALLLACLGLYGTLNYMLGLRRREVGLRLALGASRGAVVWHLVGQALGVVGLACGVGLVLSLALARALGGMLFGVSHSDPLTLAAVVAIVLAVSTLAALVPAGRAVLVEPIQALRHD